MKVLKRISKFVLPFVFIFVLLFSTLPAFAYSQFTEGQYVDSIFGNEVIYSNYALMPFVATFGDGTYADVASGDMSPGSLSIETGYSGNGSFYFNQGVVTSDRSFEIINYKVDISSFGFTGYATYWFDRGFLSERRTLVYEPILMAGNSYRSEGYNFICTESYQLQAGNSNHLFGTPGNITLQNPGTMYLHTDVLSDMSSELTGIDRYGGFVLPVNYLSFGSETTSIEVVFTADFQLPGQSDLHVRDIIELQVGGPGQSDDDLYLYNSSMDSYYFPLIFRESISQYLRNYTGPFSLSNVCVQYTDLDTSGFLVSGSGETGQTRYLNTIQAYSLYQDPMMDNYQAQGGSQGIFSNSNVYEDLFLVMSIDDDGSYNEGYNAGYDAGDSNGYDKGFGEGYSEGYNVGYLDGDSSVNQQDAFSRGYNIGYDDGYYNRNKNLNFSAWLATAVSGFLDFPIFSTFRILDLLVICIAVCVTVLFLKFFAGG